MGDAAEIGDCYNTEELAHVYDTRVSPWLNEVSDLMGGLLANGKTVLNGYSFRNCRCDLDR